MQVIILITTQIKMEQYKQPNCGSNQDHLCDVIFSYGIYTQICVHEFNVL